MLASGGLDSIAAWRLLGCPHAIYFPLGTEAQPSELAAITWAQRQPWARRAIEVGHRVRMAEHEGLNGYLPYRNLILVALAAQRDPHVVVPMIAEWAPDKNRRFFRRLARLLTDAGRGDFQEIDTVCKIATPFAHTTKTELLIRYAEEFGVADTFDLLDHSWSCYRYGRFHCGRCSGCVQRYVAEVNAGLRFTCYQQTPDVRGFYTRLSLVDAWRWLRGNGHLSVRDLARRALEARRSFATPASASEETGGRSV